MKGLRNILDEIQMEKLLKVNEVSELLGIPKGSVYNLVHEGRIPVVKLGNGRVRFKPSSLEKWINSMEKKGRITRKITEKPCLFL